MQIRFLLGSAGTGKTFCCLSEIREALRASADGLPLILLAPKQATFQLERQLLAEPAPIGLPGYTRLHILSFERLAHFVFDRLGRPVPRFLSEEGRVMVLRALLEQKRGELKLFRASARLPGFARQLSELMRELQHYHLNPARLEELAAKIGQANHLEAKLRDLSLLLRTYRAWLEQHQLEDADQLLDRAADELKKSRVQNPESKVPSTSRCSLPISALWLDGFARLTPQERQLLSAVVSCADQSTIAFCLDGEPEQDPSWHSIWAPITETFLRCRADFSALPGAEVAVETLKRIPSQNRFQNHPPLQHLEKYWAAPQPYAVDKSAKLAGRDSAALPPSQFPLRLVACPTPELEVEFAAREIRRYVRESNGRYRDVAVLLRSLDSYRHSVRRIFSRYGIPFFLDCRESVAHHPLAELTRYALRLAVFGWEHEDWFGALKTGLAHDDEGTIDVLENEALARGWRGKAAWLQPMAVSADSSSSEGHLEQLRQKLVAPFHQFFETLVSTHRNPTGAQLAAAFRQLWRTLRVEKKLERWSSDTDLPRRGVLEGGPAVHEAVWEQMIEWLKNLEMAFSNEALALNEWLPVLEAGLANLSVGAIPPSLDQVLVGAVDRSRNPDLQLALVLGANEGVFPAPPATPALLNRMDREILAAQNAPLGPGHLQQIGMERFLGYIACTRARNGLVLTWAHGDADGRELNPSPLVSDLKKLFPELPTEEFSKLETWTDAEHWSELIVPVLKNNVFVAQPSWRSLSAETELVTSRWEQATTLYRNERLPAELVEKVYGPELRTSVSGLEAFAECPFKFFVGRGLRAEERLEFEIDPREKGSFQHEVLKEFHLRVQQAAKRWRDISTTDARQWIREAGEKLLPDFRNGLFTTQSSRRFAAQMLIAGLERLMETLILWTQHYQFDPITVETGFGLPGSSLPAWRIDLDDQHALLLRGRIDRIDLCRIAETGDTLGVVVDYKSSARQIDPVLLHHGLELQLLAYLGALAQFQDFQADVSKVIPAGAFYVALRGSGVSAKTRDEEKAERETSRRAGCQHQGRFDGGHLNRFDGSGSKKGDQFRFSLTKDGSFASRGNDALSSADFHELIRQVESFLRRHGQEIYAGNVDVAPYRWKKDTACDFCCYRPICRFDPWTQPYRVLRPPVKSNE